MPPKKKGNKRQDEDWEAELGEAAPEAPAPQAETPEDGADGETESAPVGGLMAALRKNKAKKAKKGKANDFVEGEDPAAAADLASKEPEEGTFDEDDVFAGKPKKATKEVPAAKPAAAEEGDGEFRVKSKKEKEKEKKEREKQRKKEQVRLGYYLRVHSTFVQTNTLCLGCHEEEAHTR